MINDNNAGASYPLLQEKHTHEKKCYERHHVTLKNARININPWSFITRDDKLLFKESSCYGPNPNDHWIFQTIKLPYPKKIKGKSLFLSSRTNYWHLLSEELCDLLLLTENNVELNYFDQIIFEKPSYPALKEIHKIFGLNQIRQVSLQKSHHLDCEELHFFTGTFNLSKHALNGVRKKILNYYAGTFEISREKPKRIIVTRGSSTTRRWLNEKDCLDALISMGFILIDPNNLSLLQQVEQFQNAEVVIGPHGAGLTNIMFCNTGTKVIEIRSNEQGGEYSSANCYEELSSIFGIEHHIFHCPSLERKELKGRSIEDADLVPDPMKLKNFVSEKVLI